MPSNKMKIVPPTVGVPLKHSYAKDMATTSKQPTKNTLWKSVVSKVSDNKSSTEPKSNKVKNTTM